MFTNTLSEIMSYATRRTGRRADIPPSVVSGYVNQAYLEIAEAVPHALLESITTYSLSSGSHTITLPADFNEPIALVGAWASLSTDSSARSSYATIERVRVSDGLISDRSSGGRPNKAVFYDDRIELYPSSDTTMDLGLYYRAFPSTLTDPASVPSLATPWRWAIVLRTEALLHEDLQNDQAAAIAQNRYLSYVQTRKTDEARRASSEMRNYVRPLWNANRRRT